MNCLIDQLIWGIMTQIDRAQLMRLLRRWQSGEIDGNTVQSEAEYMVEQLRPLPEYAQSDPRSICKSVLKILESLSSQLVMVIDIPAMMDFLATPPGRELAGWVHWHGYWSSIDFDQRLKVIMENPNSIDIKP